MRDRIPAERLRFFFARHGMALGDLALLDITDAVLVRMKADDVAFDVALWRYWRDNHQRAYPLEPQRCQQEACGNEFLSWSGRRYRYCCRRCKIITQNTRWYYRHRDAMIARVMAYKRSTRIG